MRRVVITGMGVVSALGTGVPAFRERLHVPKNAVRAMPELEKYRGMNSRLGAPVQGFTPPAHFTRKVTRTMGPVSVMAVVSAEEALAQAGLLGDPVLQSGRTGIAYGSSSGSVGPISDFYSMIATNEVKHITSSTYIKIMSHTCAVNMSLYFKTIGRLYPTGTACTSGSLAIGHAYEAIRYGLQDVMIAGGAEEFSPTQVAVFDTLYATSTRNDTPEITPAPLRSRYATVPAHDGDGSRTRARRCRNSRRKNRLRERARHGNATRRYRGICGDARGFRRGNADQHAEKLHRTHARRLRRNRSRRFRAHAERKMVYSEFESLRNRSRVRAVGLHSRRRSGNFRRIRHEQQLRFRRHQYFAHLSPNLKKNKTKKRSREPVRERFFSCGRFIYCAGGKLIAPPRRSSLRISCVRFFTQRL